MNCQEFEILIVVGIYGRHTSTDRDELINHLRECQKCAQSFKRYESCLGMTENIEEPPKPDWEKSWTKISDKRKQAKPKYSPTPKFAIAVAAFVVVFLIGFFTGKRYFQQNSYEYTFFSKADDRNVSPIHSYAERAELFLIDFMNRSTQYNEREILKFEEKIITGMVIQTQLLKLVISQRDEPYQQHLLEDLELLLISMSNLRPGDKDAAHQLNQFIREQKLLSRLRQLSDLSRI